MRLVVVIFAMIAVALIGAEAHGQDRQLFETMRSQESLSPQVQRRISQRQADIGDATIAVGRFDPAAIRQVSIGDRLDISVSQELTVRATTISVRTNQNGRTVLLGETQGQPGMPPGLTTLVIDGDNIAGSVQAADGRQYRVYPLGNGDTAVIELDYESLPPDHSPGDPLEDSAQPREQQQRQTRPVQRGPTNSPQPARTESENDEDEPLRVQATSPEFMRRLSPDTQMQISRPLSARLIERHRDWSDLSTEIEVQQIDVLVAYTGDARRAAEDVFGDVELLIDLAIAETNASFRNSNVWVEINLVDTMHVTYNETAQGMSRPYSRMVMELAARGDVYLRRVHTRRNREDADIVILIVDQDQSCGRAAAISAEAETAFAVVHWDCATGYYSFGHEIGHLLGARHNPESDPTDTPFSFGHGFRFESPGNGWRTVMSYDCPNFECPFRLPYWSSPLNVVSGTPAGDSNLRNNAQVWAERAEEVAGFR